MQGAVYCFN